MCYSDNRQWSDKFIPKLKMIAGVALIQTASIADDMVRNSDLIVPAACRIACRVRRNEYLLRYPHDFTVRSENNGRVTELAKVMLGWGDYMIYAFANAGASNIAAWRMIDLHAFSANYYKIKLTHKRNNDGTEFITCDVRTLPHGVIVASAGF